MLRYVDMLSFKFPLVALISLCFFVSAQGADGWDLLLQNKSKQAEESFLQIIKKNPKGKKAAEAYIGLSEVAKYNGNKSLANDYCLDAWDAYSDSQLFISCLYKVSLQLYHSTQEKSQRTIRVTKQLMQKSPESLVATELWNAVSEVYIHEGKKDSAKLWNEKLGFLNYWKYVGPFNNVSNGGLFTSFDVEKGFSFSEKYKGLSGRQVEWRSLYPEPISWIHLDYYQNIPDAVNYFATTVVSPKATKAFVNLGLSGVFSLWINGTKVMENSVFQNTGVDIFRTPVTLRQGKNHILLKLGHEKKQSNFVLRFTDEKGFSILLPHAPEPQPAVENQSKLKKNSVMNTTESSIKKAIQKNPKSILWKLASIQYRINTEQFNQAKTEILQLLKKYPKSSLLHSALSENYRRENNKALADDYMEKAYRLDSSNADAWNSRFSQIVGSQDIQVADTFYNNCPPQIYKTPEILLTRAMIDAQLGRQMEFFSVIDTLANNHYDNTLVVETLMNVFEQISSPSKTDLLMKKVSREYSNHSRFISFIFQWHKKRGRNEEAVQLLQSFLKKYPKYTQFYNLLYSHFTGLQEYGKAAQAMQDLLKVNPFISSTYINLGEAQLALGDTGAAIQFYKKALEANYADFAASNRLQEIQKRTKWSDLATSFSIDSLRVLSKKFSKGKNKNSLFLLSQRSLIIHPTEAYETIDHSVIEVLDQKGIDEWKEYTIPVYSNDEIATVMHAHIVKSDGKTINAERNKRQLVFINLQAGDLIDIKISRKYNMAGELAKQFESFFYMGGSLPRALSYFEIIAPDTLKYNIKQEKQNIKPVVKKLGGEYSKKIFRNSQVPGLISEEKMGPADINLPWIQISSFSNWADISHWYNTLSRGKSIVTKEVEHVADSLFAKAKTPAEKIKKVHLYITEKIRYSYMPFRQSGFVPQDAATTLATQVGDCKDMAVLAQAMLRRGGISSKLVLVQTRDDGGALLLPSIHFNHVILKVDSLFIDFTTPDNHVNTLPWIDQNTRALVVDSTENTSLFLIPLSSPALDFVHLYTEDTLLSDGTLLRKVEMKKGGNFTLSDRKQFKYKSAEELNKSFLTMVRNRYPQATISELKYSKGQNADSLITYSYKVKATNAAYTGNKSIAFVLPWNHKIEGSLIPGETTRQYIFQTFRSWSLWGEKKYTMRLQLPTGYSILDMPQAVSMSNEFGTYKTSYTIQGQTLTATRFLSLSSQDVVPEKYAAYRQFLEQIAESDKGLLILKKNE